MATRKKKPGRLVSEGAIDKLRVIAQRPFPKPLPNLRRVVVVGARPVILVESDYAGWGQSSGTDFVLPLANGAFVRLRPPLGAEERARELEAAFLAAGALGVKVEFPAREEAAPAAEVARVDPKQTSRQVVEELASKANTTDRALLAVFIEEGLVCAGL